MTAHVATTPSPRESALAFTDGSKAGWITSDLVTWTKEHLIVPGRFSVRDGLGHNVFEHGVGALTVNRSLSSAVILCGRTTSQVPGLVAAARERVLKVLRDTVRTGETGFVNAALYEGRVSRERGPDGRSVWHTYVTENDALSDQVLALFAADALTFPSDYEHGIAVCDVCGVVSFLQSAVSRYGCVSHPHGSFDGKPSDGGPRVFTRS